ncbi:MAG: ABC transporter substrate-binding protein [Stellaceae bacterium]
MRRREFVGLIGGAAVLQPLAARAQRRREVPELGVLMSVGENDQGGRLRIAAFRQALQALGWKDGENIRVEYRWGASQKELIHQYAQELVSLAPDVILANGTPVVAALRPLTRSIPIVCALVIDPVGLGFVQSLSRPGGNITGFSFVNPELIGKWTELLKDAAPRVDRAALLYNPKVNPWYADFLRDLAAVPKSVAIELVPTIVESVDDFKKRIPILARVPGMGVMIGPEAYMVDHMHEIAPLAAANRLPGISVYRQFAVEGGLMAYGPDIPDIFRRAAGYVDRILKGADPATLPVQEPAKFELVLNEKAAGALGLALSPTLLAGADQVIE